MRVLSAAMEECGMQSVERGMEAEAAKQEG